MTSIVGAANSRQVGGDHYKKAGQLEHWDVVALMGWDYFQAQITRYVDRHKRKNGKEDLEKAMHYLQKYIEVEYRVDGGVGDVPPTPAPNLEAVKRKQKAKTGRRVTDMSPAAVYRRSLYARRKAQERNGLRPGRAAKARKRGGRG